jgi:hypothetical protein
MGVIVRRNFLVASLLSTLAAASGCASAPPTTSLKLTGNVPDATVTIDDQDVGTVKRVAKHGVALPPGQHRLTVEKEGYFPFDKLIDASGKSISVDVKLDQKPD